MADTGKKEFWESGTGKFYSRIGNHGFVAANACIGYNVQTGDNLVITACSVVAGDIPPDSVVRGSLNYNIQNENVLF